MDGTELKKLRNSTKLSQERFAKMVGVSGSAISKCEQGLTKLNPNNADKVRENVAKFLESKRLPPANELNVKTALDQINADVKEQAIFLQSLARDQLVMRPDLGWNTVKTGRKLIQVMEVLGQPAEDLIEIIDRLESTLERVDSLGIAGRIHPSLTTANMLDEQNQKAAALDGHRLAEEKRRRRSGK